jgi:hypothetical protein
MFQVQAKVEKLSLTKPKPKVETLINTFRMKKLKLEDFCPTTILFPFMY